MKQFALLAFLLAIPFSLLGSSKSTKLHASALVPAFETQVTITPTSAKSVQLLTRPTPATYECSATLLSADRTQVFGDIQLVISPGSRESKTVHEEGLDIQFSVSITAKADLADARITVKKGNTVLSRQRFSVQLVATRPAANAGTRP